jgi:hypothetical protein
MNDHYSIQQRIEAIMALAMTRNKPVCPRPSEFELAAYIDGKLSEKRTGEVEQFLAYDKTLYNEWISIVQSLELIEPVSVEMKSQDSQYSWIPRFSLWLTGGGIGATALAVLTMVYLVPMLYLNTMHNSIDQSYDEFIPLYAKKAISKNWSATSSVPKTTRKSFDFGQLPTEFDNHKQAFSVGVKTGLQLLVPQESYWENILDQLPNQHQVCEDENCLKLQSILQRVGEYSALVYTACELETGVKGTFWDQQPEMINGIAQVLKQYDKAALFYDFFADWQQSFEDGDDPHPAICARIDALLLAGLR